MNFFKDNQGKIVIFQKPNSPLIGWIVFLILGLLVGHHQPRLHELCNALRFGFIFTWAWLEITSGVNYFRRTLGLIVLFVVVLF